MFDVEKLVSDYADKINILDTGLSSQVSAFSFIFYQAGFLVENSSNKVS